MKTKEEIKKFVLDTLLPYKQDPSTCAWDNSKGQCMYLTPDNKKCAVGKHMVEGEWQKSTYAIRELSREHGINNMLLPEARSYDFSLTVWQYMQKYHDTIGGHEHNAVSKATRIKDHVLSLEQYLDIKLPELLLES